MRGCLHQAAVAALGLLFGATAASDDFVLLKAKGGTITLKPRWVDREDLRYLFANCDGIATGQKCVIPVTGIVTEIYGDPGLTDVDFDIPH
jgi:hypothetical protein